MNARLIEKATTLKTTKGESQNAFKRINQAKVSAIRLTHTGREVSPSGLKTDAGASGKKRGGGAWVRWLTHTGIGTTSVRKPPDREHASLLLSPEGDT
jgi:hypothetical protein